MLVEQCRIEIGHPKGRVVRRLPGIVGNLKGAVRHAAHEGQAAGGIEHGREIEKSLFLRRAVVNRFVRRCRIFYSQIVLQKAPGHEILGLSDRAAIFEARRDRAVAAAIDADAAGVVEGVRLGLDVQHAGRAQAILRRQRAGEQRQAADDAGVEDLPERADAVGEHDAVDAILQIGVLVAHMQFAARGRILRDAGELQQHLVQRRVVALRQRLDGLMADLVGAWRRPAPECSAGQCRRPGSAWRPPPPASARAAGWSPPGAAAFAAVAVRPARPRGSRAGHCHRLSAVALQARRLLRGAGVTLSCGALRGAGWRGRRRCNGGRLRRGRAGRRLRGVVVLRQRGRVRSGKQAKRRCG